MKEATTKKSLFKSGNCLEEGGGGDGQGPAWIDLKHFFVAKFTMKITMIKVILI